MSNGFYQLNNNTSSSTKNKKNNTFFNQNRHNKSNRRIESANTNFTVNSHYNINLQNKNISNQSISSENYTDNNNNINFQNSKSKSDYHYRPKWKYSYYINKNDILNLNNLNNNPEIKNSLFDFKDIDKRPKHIVYSWTKPRMIKILENNSLIEEEVKSHYWKYSHIFENNAMKPPGKLLRLLMNQLSSGYVGDGSFLDFNNNGFIGDEGNFRYQQYLNRQWKVPGISKNYKNYYEPIKLKRPKSSYKY
jgi:hypothetical protein